MIHVQNENNRQSKLSQPLCQSRIHAGGQDDRLPRMDAEPAHVWDSLQRVCQAGEARVAQREWIAAAEDHFFDRGVASYLI
jgi:hypothetical protein